MMGDYGGMGWFGPGFGGLFMVAWWVLVIAGIVILVRWLMSSARNTPLEKNAREILDERYARGEIDREDYERRKHDLTA